MGNWAGSGLEGNYNTTLGYEAGRGATGSACYYNIAIGHQTGYDLLSAEYSILIGTEAGRNITSGDNNICIGHDAGTTLTTGSDNILIGDGATGTTSSDTNTFRLQNGTGTLMSGDFSTGTLSVPGTIACSDIKEATNTLSIFNYDSGTAVTGISAGISAGAYIHCMNTLRLPDEIHGLISSPQPGMIIYSSVLNKFLGYIDSKWVSFDTTDV